MTDARLKRIRLRSWRRGTKEMDLLLGPFADVHAAKMSAAELDLYETFLTENDQELYAWMTGREAPPERFVVLVERVLQHAEARIAQHSDTL